MCPKSNFRSRGLRLIAGALLIATCLAHALDQASEYIEGFHADIVVHEDTSLTVREDVLYVTGPRRDKHGIVRDFPTKYEDELGRQIRVRFEILSIERDGKKEPFKTTGYDVGTRIFIGDPYIFLAPGTHHYTIAYNTNRQLLRHTGYDELYWNVNGNYWPLPIRSVSATVHFPVGVSADQIEVSAYTGALGQQGRDYQISRDPDGAITITSTRPFAPREALTISLSLPTIAASSMTAGAPRREVFHTPGMREELNFFARHHLGIILMLLGLLALLLLHLVAWLRLRRTQGGTIIPLFHPVDQLPPSAHRYLLKGYADHRQLTADIVQLAVEKFLRIEMVNERRPAKYQLIKLPTPKNPPTALQQDLLTALFGPDATDESRLVLGETARSQVHDAFSRLGRWLRTMLNKNFKFEWRYTAVGTASTILLALTAYPLEPIMGAAVLILGTIMLGMNAVALWVHRIYTPEGCTLRDQVKGFALYLKTAESERIAAIGTPPTRTPELYERYLPYAIALRAEAAWNAQFAPVFARLARAQAAYTPTWFVGRGHALGGTGFDPDLFVHDIQAFSRSLNIPTQTTPTRVTSGRGGGGFSGGGRGGGGGGSW
ncbi:MAG: DUF2207 domain-containing protein [Candidatus Dependentiae bacterium]|nr:DUF2207 domain-containing protein [Candidatus Dependentiae bacterium]